MSARWVGKFRELSDDVSDESMHDAVNGMSETEASVVARYLRSGLGLIDVMELRPDVIDGTRISESASILGDGDWVWREDLAHYVEKYRIALEPDFLASIVRQVETPSDQRLEQIIGEAMRLWQGT